jgi:hypothetical protein
VSETARPGFDLDRLEAFAVEAIAVFAASHEHELFDGFAIDAALLCLSLASDTEAGRAHLASRGEATEDAIDAMRRETGDWSYQGFAEMSAEHGFDRAAYRSHYDLDDAAQPRTADRPRRLRALAPHRRLPRDPRRARTLSPEWPIVFTHDPSP